MFFRKQVFFLSFFKVLKKILKPENFLIQFKISVASSHAFKIEKHFVSLVDCLMVFHFQINSRQWLRVESFLCYFRLDTGCLIIGWLISIYFGLFFIATNALIIYFVFEDFDKVLDEDCCESEQEKMLMNFLKGGKQKKFKSKFYLRFLSFRLQQERLEHC